MARKLIPHLKLAGGERPAELNRHWLWKWRRNYIRFGMGRWSPRFRIETGLRLGIWFGIGARNR